MPAMKIEQAVEAFDEYQKLREKLEREGDFVEFKTREGKKKAPTKQWRVKLERFFGLSVEIVREWETREEDGSITYHKRARVTHPKTGLFHEATGACNTKEKERDGAKKYHNAETHAETRAKNRAVLEFVGFGEVSAEEIEENGYQVHTEEKPKPSKTKFKPATDSQIKKIYAQINQLAELTGNSKEFILEEVKKGAKVEHLDKKHLSLQKASRLIDVLGKEINKKNG